MENKLNNDGTITIGDNLKARWTDSYLSVLNLNNNVECRVLLWDNDNIEEMILLGDEVHDEIEAREKLENLNAYNRSNKIIETLKSIYTLAKPNKNP